jgi:2-polyprenyl-3-methyl-5-hydroxy-6-metoxy-1,4-benzoquinol methylase
VKPDKEDPPERKIPTVLVRCNPMIDENGCGLLQMQASVPPEVLYSSYWYRSGTNDTMRRHLQSIVEESISMVKKTSATVLDIGCNDGTLFNFYPSGYYKVGIDPSDIAQEIREDNNLKIIQDFFPSEELITVMDGRKFDIITGIAMFYDLEDPVYFTQKIKDVLSPDGLWIFEMSYMPTMLRMNAYDTICHEHLEYYSLAVIENILKKSNMKLVNAQLNSINGGSIRCYATHSDTFLYKKSEYIRNIKRLRQEEFDMELDTDKPYKHFKDQIKIHREELNGLLRKYKKLGKKIHIYGASTKGNTILQWCGLDSRLIDAAADRNPEKHGAYTLGTRIPIISEEESRALNPDYYLVLPWHFKEEFLVREKKTLEKGIQMIFPLPNIHIFGNKVLDNVTSQISLT